MTLLMDILTETAKFLLLSSIQVINLSTFRLSIGVEDDTIDGHSD